MQNKIKFYTEGHARFKISFFFNFFFFFIQNKLLTNRKIELYQTNKYVRFKMSIFLCLRASEFPPYEASSSGVAAAPPDPAPLRKQK